MERSVFLAALIAVVALSATACGGLAFIEEPVTRCERHSDCGQLERCIDQVCTEAVACSQDTPAEENWCPDPDAEICCSGVCVDSGSCGSSGWCPDCPSGFGCEDGACVPVSCSPTNLDGVCPGSDACCDGKCIPLVDTCAPDNPDGICPTGAACVEGYCQPIAARTCLDFPGDGLCPACQACQANGSCQVVQCGPQAAVGSCPTGEYCDAGVCVKIPCGPFHIADGWCEAGQFCGCDGECIADGSCACDTDCLTNQLCSCDGLCINQGTCLCDDDCGPFNMCNTTSSACERDYTCQTTPPACMSGEWCSSTNDCIPEDSCRVNADCTDGTNSKCSMLDTAVDCLGIRTNPLDCICVGPDECRSDDDCVNPLEPKCVAGSGANGTCAPENYCTEDDDCRPGYVCNIPSNACELDTSTDGTCDGNDLTSFGCSGTPVCCASGVDCCGQGQICATAPDCGGVPCVCVDVGECWTDADCTTGFTCDIPSNTCVPTDTNCTIDSDCSTVTGCMTPGACHCSTLGTCIITEVCADDRDCSAGEICNAEFSCEPATACGTFQPVSATLIKPNVMLTLDKSGSMQFCGDGGTGSCCGTLTCGGDPFCVGSGSGIACDGSTSDGTRWAQALDAIDNLTFEHNVLRDSVRFGLSIYPRRCGTGGVCDWTGALSQCTGHDACGFDCNACSCGDFCPAGSATNNFNAGVVDVGVGDQTRTEINLLLGETYPGGATPTGPTLRDVLADPAAAGVDDPTRENVVVLLTDGEANEEGGGTGWTGVGSCTDNDPACKVNSVLDDLGNLTPPVSTYVIGFAFSGISTNLNCHAVSGGTSRCATANDCSAVTVEGSCLAGEGCIWSNPGGAGTCGGRCSAFTKENRCDAEIACVWSNPGGDGVCSGGWCSSLTDETRCDAALSCTWSNPGGAGTCAGGVDASNCGSVPDLCYYEADDSAALSVAFTDIITNVASCTYDLGAKPSNAGDLYVYMQYPGSGPLPADCSNPGLRLCRLDEGATTYQYVPDLTGSGTDEVTFLGAACTDVRGGAGTPVMIWGCCVGECG